MSGQQGMGGQGGWGGGFGNHFGTLGGWGRGLLGNWQGGPGTQMPGRTQALLNRFGGYPVGTGDMFGQINLPQGFQPPGVPQSPSALGFTMQNGYLIPPGGFPTATAPMPMPLQTGGTAPNYGAMNPLTAGMLNGGM